VRVWSKVLDQPLFSVLKAEMEQYISTISSMQNKKAVKTVVICNTFNVFM